MTDKYDVYEFVQHNEPVNVSDVEAKFDLTFAVAQDYLTKLRGLDLIELNSDLTYEMAD